jgi:2-polyprenyl-6-methoxyphenol hydroxylase-like FAD-dependent oxidoreductase
MNAGMQNAFNLAWKLALVVRKTCDEHLLDSYSPERSKVGDEVLKAASRLTTVGTLKQPGRPDGAKPHRSRHAGPGPGSA